MDYRKLADEYFIKYYKFRKIHLSRIDENFRGEASALYHIVDSDNGIAPKDIAEKTGVSSARVAATLNSLENKKYITREIDKNNRRNIIVLPTEEGRKVAKENTERAICSYKNMLEFLGEKDAIDYLRITDKLLEFYKNK